MDMDKNWKTPRLD